MGLETSSDYIGVAVLLAFGIVCIIILIWLNIIRKRRIKHQRARLIAQPFSDAADDSYNIVASTRSISDVLKSKGIDTADADKLIKAAETELDKRNYKRASMLAERAKALLSAKNIVPQVSESPKPKTELPSLKPDRTADLLRGVDVFGDTRPADAVTSEDVSDSFKLRTRLPQNLMQAKFEIKCAETAINNAKEKNMDYKNAEQLLTKAKEFFENKDYTQSLSYALRAKRIAEGKKVEIKPVAPKPAIEEVPKKRLCPDCKTVVDDDDLFCRKCGVKLKPSVCPNCKITVDKEDLYCRKCGTKLSAETQKEVQNYQCPVCQSTVPADATVCHVCGVEFE
jgi:RNA polymerase subunit RPABC4/transcription elongation factor Spt4